MERALQQRSNMLKQTLGNSAARGSIAAIGTKVDEGGECRSRNGLRRIGTKSG